jgi:hypothetical protein
MHNRNTDPVDPRLIACTTGVLLTVIALLEHAGSLDPCSLFRFLMFLAIPAN